jgi:tRNA-2-methylthio-N6-dimethylallyladenosine synthase
MMMAKYYIWTIGCQMNKAESERLGGYLEQEGYQAVARPEEADLVVLNSCVVRQSAENRVIGRLNALKSVKRSKPELTLAVTGCFVNSEIRRLRERFPNVDYFFKPGEPPPWLAPTEVRPVIPRHPAPATFVPIIQGCNNFCAYCIVPYRRGREKSRPAGEVVGEVRELACLGVREVTLLGQNVDSYGRDLAEKPDLALLLGELNAIEGIERIRFLTNHPKDMSSRLIEAVASLDKVCEEISLPVQSGSNAVLKAMRRGYTVERYCELITEIRLKIPGIALSTDVIVGFPLETEAQFQETCDLLLRLRFDKVHVAGYSPRPGTIALRDLVDNIPLTEKKARLSQIEKLQERIAGEINAGLLDKTVEILVEGRHKGKWQGRTRTGKLVFFHSNDNYLGRLVKVNVTKVSPWALQGNLDTDSSS